MMIFAWIAAHKKLTALIFAFIFLVIFVIFTIFQTVKNRFFPSLNPVTQTTENTSSGTNNFATMLVNTPKNNYSLSEKIPVKIMGNSDEKAVTAFDILIEYDGQFLTLDERKPPPLSDFLYFGKNDQTTISVSAVLKPQSNASQIFKGTILLELEFSPKKIGKTRINLIYSPGSTNESNLLDNKSTDVLSNVYGAEIDIQ